MVARRQRERQERWSVDEIARRAGTTVRNVRLYHERGLLPPPRREGRRAWYGPQHLRRLELVINMLARGYPTAAIRELLEAWEARKSVADVLGCDEPGDEDPEVTVEPRRLTAEQVGAMFPGADAAAFQRAVELGVLVADGDGFLAPNPVLLDVGAELVANGVPLPAVLDVAGEIQRSAEHLAQVFVALFNDHVWQPFVDAGMPPDDLEKITEFLSRDRAVAVAVVGPAVALAMQREKARPRSGVLPPAWGDEGSSRETSP